MLDEGIQNAAPSLPAGAVVVHGGGADMVRWLLDRIVPRRAVMAGYRLPLGGKTARLTVFDKAVPPAREA